MGTSWFSAVPRVEEATFGLSRKDDQEGGFPGLGRGVLGGVAVAPPRWGGRGGSCALYGHCTGSPSTAAPSAVAMVTGWPGEGRGPSSPPALQERFLNGLRMKGTFGCWSLDAWPLPASSHVWGESVSFCSK